MNIRRRSHIQKWLRDYMVPLIGWVLLIILLFSIFSWNDNPKTVDTENKIWLNLTLNWANSEAYIIYPWNYKKKIEWDISLYKWEQLTIKEWDVSLSLPQVWNLRLSKLWELKYLENWDFSLSSADLWLNSISDLNILMKFATVKVSANTHISFSQNEMGSTIYLLSWFAEVENLAWKTTVLAPWQQITITRVDASNKDIDLSLAKWNLDDYYKQSDWFILNNWMSFLTTEDKTNEETSSWTLTWTWTIKKDNNTGSNLISFSNLLDESNISSDTISISWNYFDEEITDIVLNWKSAILNKDLQTFKFENISMPNKENNLVFKVLNDSWEILSKFVYTIYNDWGVANTNNWSTNWATNDWTFKSKTFDIDGTQFKFTQPTTTESYTSKEDFITIRWLVSATWISKVTVNDYQLNSFNWSTWRYHASTDNNNLSVWTNIYEIKYYDANWKVVYTNYFNIIKTE